MRALTNILLAVFPQTASPRPSRCCEPLDFFDIASRLDQHALRVFIIVLCVLSAKGIASDPTVIRFTTNDDGLVILPARFGTGIVGHVFLDTGSGVDVLSPQ